MSETNQELWNRVAVPQLLERAQQWHDRLRLLLLFDVVEKTATLHGKPHIIRYDYAEDI